MQQMEADGLEIDEVPAGLYKHMSYSLYSLKAVIWGII